MHGSIAQGAAPKSPPAAPSCPGGHPSCRAGTAQEPAGEGSKISPPAQRPCSPSVPTVPALPSCPLLLPASQEAPAHGHAHGQQGQLRCRACTWTPELSTKPKPTRLCHPCWRPSQDELAPASLAGNRVLCQPNARADEPPCQVTRAELLGPICFPV